MTPKETATGIAEALADVETAIAGSDQETASEAVKVLHKKLRGGLYRHREALSLTDEDVADIDNLGPQRRGGGEPKEAMSSDDAE